MNRRYVPPAAMSVGTVAWASAPVLSACLGLAGAACIPIARRGARSVRAMA